MLLTNKSSLNDAFVHYYIEWILGRFSYSENLRVFYGPSKDYEIQLSNSEFDLVFLSDKYVNHKNINDYINPCSDKIVNFDIISYVSNVLNDKGGLNTETAVDIHNRLQPRQLNYSYPFLDDLILEILSSHKSLNVKKFAATYSLSHDIDNLFAFNSPKMFARAAKRIISKGSVLNRMSHLGRLCINYVRSDDPYYNLKNIADHSDTLGIKSRFYFMVGGQTKYDNRYAAQDATDIVEYLVGKGHIVGLHPSYATYNDMKQIQHEFETFERTFGFKAKHVRHHYLRFSDESLEMFNTLGVEHDFSSGFGCTPGYRNGTNRPFRKSNDKSRLHEMLSHPLSIMDTTLLGYKKLNYQQIIEYVQEQIEVTIKFGGNLELLWHNSNMFWYNDIDEWKLYQEITAMLSRRLEPLSL